MKIVNHFLYDSKGKQVTFKDSPNKKGLFTPSYLVIHYTAATTAISCINWFLNKNAQASAHLLISRDGAITQFVAFNRIAFHAGESQWAGLSGMNRHSIGIELQNAGRLNKVSNKWVCPVDNKVVADDDVIVATHKNESTSRGWQAYTDAQLEVSIEVSTAIVRHYKLKDVLGHEDISPLRKSDPGPAFPMGSFRSRVMGRSNEKIDTFEVNTDGLNIRSGPGTQFQTILSEGLPVGTKVQVLKREGNWSFVEVKDIVSNLMDLEGWVFSRFLSQ
jgi:N-acetylmuramoyl-L-alanine amidase